MGEMLAQAYHASCLALGRSLRRARYSRAIVVVEDGERKVRKRRAFHAPLLVWLGVPLMRVLGTGVRVLPRREWEERERLMYRDLHGREIRVGPDGALILPCLGGVPLATLLEDPALDAPARRWAIELSVAALAGLHARGFTHGDAMAENVLVDLDAGVANWIDFETLHDPGRPIAWRRSDDLRALLTSCMIHAGRGPHLDAPRSVLGSYPDERVRRVLGATFASAWRRPLVFHLGQAALSFERSRELALLLHLPG